MSAETESATPALNVEKCTVVLVDVLGTTTSINFMKETLAPFVIKHAEEFLKAQWDTDAVKSAVKSLKEDTTDLDVAAAVELVKDLTGKSSENKALKEIQGLIYKKGYEDGELKGHVFPDVPTSFKTWSQSKQVAIYSTGSAESQKQLFGKTTEGDLTAYITKYFDQSTGVKTEADSYKNITKVMAVEAEQIVFITDNVSEAKAAKVAGLSVAVISREGNEKVSDEDLKVYPVINSFADIVFESSTKRKISEEDTTVDEAPPAKQAKTATESSAEDASAAKSDNAMDVEPPKPEEEKEVETEEKQTQDKSEAMETNETEVSQEKKTEQETTKVESSTETKEIFEEEKPPVEDEKSTIVEKPSKNGEVVESKKTEEIKEVTDVEMKDSDSAKEKEEVKEAETVESESNGIAETSGKIDTKPVETKTEETEKVCQLTKANIAGEKVAKADETKPAADEETKNTVVEEPVQNGSCTKAKADETKSATDEETKNTVVEEPVQNGTCKKETKTDAEETKKTVVKEPAKEESSNKEISETKPTENGETKKKEEPVKEDSSNKETAKEPVESVAKEETKTEASTVEKKKLEVVAKSSEESSPKVNSTTTEEPKEAETETNKQKAETDKKEELDKSEVLSNGLNNGKVETAEVVTNGEKVNGEDKVNGEEETVKENGDDITTKTAEIKVKKIEETSTAENNSTPAAVSVEV